jgi:hypothetical protein
MLAAELAHVDIAIVERRENQDIPNARGAGLHARTIPRQLHACELSRRMRRWPQRGAQASGHRIRRVGSNPSCRPIA